MIKHRSLDSRGKRRRAFLVASLAPRRVALLAPALAAALVACGGGRPPVPDAQKELIYDPQGPPPLHDPSSVVDLAPSVVAAAGADTSNPELDSLVRAAHAAGIPDGMLPPAARRRDAAASGGDMATSAGRGAEPDEGGSIVPLVSGLRITSTLVFPDGDRENVVTTEVSQAGATYTWLLRQQSPSGQAKSYTLRRFVRANDLAGAPRRNDIVGTDGPEETPGYTFVTLSRATFRALRTGSPVRYTTTGMEEGLLGDALGGLGAARVTYKGTLSLVAPSPVPIPVLLDGKRTMLPALHVRGEFAWRERREVGDYWILADSTHPLILKEVNGDDVLQVVRIDRPAATGGLEETMARDCRAELPGIYFAFVSADLDPASDDALQRVAAMLGRHADWSVAIEGHTDNVGSASANRALSQGRAESVRAALVGRYRIAAGRVSAAGFGATRPAEPNTTVEGRARNRRVELVRPCTRR